MTIAHRHCGSGLGRAGHTQLSAFISNDLQAFLRQPWNIAARSMSPQTVTTIPHGKEQIDTVRAKSLHLAWLDYVQPTARRGLCGKLGLKAAPGEGIGPALDSTQSARSS